MATNTPISLSSEAPPTQPMYTENVISIIQEGMTVKIIYHSSKQNYGVKLTSTSSGSGGFGDGSRSKDSIRHSLRKVKQIIACNDFSHFVTITCNEENYNRYSEWFVTNLSDWMKSQRNKYKLDIIYLAVPERHEDLAWHVHMLIGGVPKTHFKPLPFGHADEVKPRGDIGCDNLTLIWPECGEKFGHTEVAKIWNPVKLCEYVCKRWISGDRTLLRESPKQLYIPSRNLNEPVLLGEYQCANDVIDESYALGYKGFDWGHFGVALQCFDINELPLINEEIAKRCENGMMELLPERLWAK